MVSTVTNICPKCGEESHIVTVDEIYASSGARDALFMAWLCRNCKHQWIVEVDKAMKKQQDYKHFPRAQTIVHDCIEVLGDHNVYRFGAGVIKIERGVIGSYVFEVTLDIIGAVFKAQTQASGVKNISFPNTRFATTNTHGLVVIGVSILRDGTWREKLRERADHYRQRGTKEAGDFEPVDDAELWE